MQRQFRFAVVSLALAVLAVSCSGDDDPAAPTSTIQASTSPTGGASTATGAPSSPSGDPPPLAYESVASGFSRPTFVTNAADGSNRLFVLEKVGRIRIIKDGTTLSAPFLDLSSLVLSSGNEQGLLGLAFHPEFESNGRFFVAYTARDAANTVAEYRVSSSNADSADPASRKQLFAVPDQFANHNGGMLAFGKDGYLYISMGDGGSGGDPNGNGQNLNAMLGKLLRIDVNSGDPYGIPPSNPFVSNDQARKEVWAYGLRNPWRFSFDRVTGDMWIADVGQNKYEEIDFQPADSRGGENYGWNVMEGAHCYKPAEGCKQEGLVQPVFEFDHGEGCSVTGGYVYRGKSIAGLAGRYIFTDYCTPKLWVTTKRGEEFETSDMGNLPKGISSFGEDEAGELYFVTDSQGALYRFTAK
jgi:glucose/arabinose dehydrogenase